MSAKRRSKNIQGSQTSFEMDECSFGSRIPSASSKKSASSDNVDEYVAKNQSSFEMKVEPYATQTFSDDKLMPKRHPGGFCKIFWRGVRGKKIIIIIIIIINIIIIIINIISSSSNFIFKFCNMARIDIFILMFTF